MMDQEIVVRFIERAEAVAAKVTRVADEAAAGKLVAEIQSAEGSEHVGVARAAKGIAQTGAKDLPYGDYEIKESKASEGYHLNKDWKKSFQMAGGSWAT